MTSDDDTLPPEAAPSQEEPQQPQAVAVTSDYGEPISRVIELGETPELPNDPTAFVPQDTPLHGYLRWACALQGSPPVYHLACALAFAGYTLCQRGFVLRTLLEEVHPSLWFVLLGESATGKTTAISLLEAFARDVAAETQRSQDEQLFVEPQGSIPGILNALQAHHDETRGTTVALLGHDEIAQVFASREPIAELLCKLHDGRTVQHHTVTAKRVRKGSELLIQPRLCALFASTEAQLTPHFRDQHRLGGIFARLQWVKPPFTAANITTPTFTEADVAEAWQRRGAAIAEWADWEGRLSELAGESRVLRIMPSASAAIAALVEGARQAFVADNEDALHGTRMRIVKRAYVLAMVFATARGSLRIELDDAEAAVAISRCFYEHAVAAAGLGTETRDPKNQRLIRRVEQIVKKFGEMGCLKRQIYQHVRVDKDTLDKVLETLVDSETVVRDFSRVQMQGAYLHTATKAGQEALATDARLRSVQAEIDDIERRNRRN